MAEEVDLMNVTCDKTLDISLKSLQQEALKNLVSGQDMFIILSTRSGKSPIFLVHTDYFLSSFFRI